MWNNENQLDVSCVAAVGCISFVGNEKAAGVGKLFFLISYPAERQRGRKRLRTAVIWPTSVPHQVQ